MENSLPFLHALIEIYWLHSSDMWSTFTHNLFDSSLRMLSWAWKLFLPKFSLRGENKINKIWKRRKLWKGKKEVIGKNAQSPVTVINEGRRQVVKRDSLRHAFLDSIFDYDLLFHLLLFMRTGIRFFTTSFSTFLIQLESSEISSSRAPLRAEILSTVCLISCNL